MSAQWCSQRGVSRRHVLVLASRGLVLGTSSWMGQLIGKRARALHTQWCVAINTINTIKMIWDAGGMHVMWPDGTQALRRRTQRNWKAAPQLEQRHSSPAPGDPDMRALYSTENKKLEDLQARSKANMADMASRVKLF